jgi:YVTN family beta-propeller protein
VTSQINIGAPTSNIAINPAGTIAYIYSLPSEGLFYVVNLLNHSMVTIPTGTNIQNIIFSIDGTKVYAADFDNNVVIVYDASSGVELTTIAVGNSPIYISMSPTGEFLYVANYNGNSVSVINTTTQSVIGSPISVSINPSGIAITPDGAVVYTANEGGNANVISTSNNMVTSTLDLPVSPLNVIVTPLSTPRSLSGIKNKNNFGIRYELYNTLSWTRGDSEETTGYNIYRNGTLIGSTSGINATTFSDHQREEGASYQYSIRGKAAGNVLSFPITLTID